jgi:hypothetical protein
MLKDFTFKVNLIAVVRVRAPDQSVAREVVPTVLGSPGSTEIALANHNHFVAGRDAAVTGVDFSMVGPIKSSKQNTASAQGHVARNARSPSLGARFQRP